jgi:hypothetical protein
MTYMKPSSPGGARSCKVKKNGDLGRSVARHCEYRKVLKVEKKSFVPLTLIYRSLTPGTQVQEWELKCRPTRVGNAGLFTAPQKTCFRGRAPLFQQKHTITFSAA